MNVVSVSKKKVIHTGLVQHEGESMLTELAFFINYVFNVCLNVSYIDRLCFCEATGTHS